jgi:hypothetical protein
MELAMERGHDRLQECPPTNRTASRQRPTSRPWPMPPPVAAKPTSRRLETDDLRAVAGLFFRLFSKRKRFPAARAEEAAYFNGRIPSPRPLAGDQECAGRRLASTQLSVIFGGVRSRSSSIERMTTTTTTPTTSNVAASSPHSTALAVAVDRTDPSTLRGPASTPPPTMRGPSVFARSVRGSSPPCLTTTSTQPRRHRRRRRHRHRCESSTRFCSLSWVDNGTRLNWLLGKSARALAASSPSLQQKETNRTHGRVRHDGGGWRVRTFCGGAAAVEEAEARRR